VILSRVGEEQGWRMFLDLAKAWKDGSLGGWRAREQLALHLGSNRASFSTSSTCSPCQVSLNVSKKLGKCKASCSRALQPPSLTCNDEIRERLYEHLDVILSRVGEEQGWRMFLDLAKAGRRSCST
jgi:hypothetical protein